MKRIGSYNIRQLDLHFAIGADVFPHEPYLKALHVTSVFTLKLKEFLGLGAYYSRYQSLAKFAAPIVLILSRWIDLGTGQPLHHHDFSLAEASVIPAIHGPQPKQSLFFLFFLSCIILFVILPL
jgi:hypothetical protein